MDQCPLYGKLTTQWSRKGLGWRKGMEGVLKTCQRDCGMSGAPQSRGVGSSSLT